MDNNYPITDRIERVSVYLRLIADLMLAGKDLRDVDLAKFAFVMEDLAAQLERALRERAKELLETTGTDRESQP